MNREKAERRGREAEGTWSRLSAGAGERGCLAAGGREKGREAPCPQGSRALGWNGCRTAGDAKSQARAFLKHEDRESVRQPLALARCPEEEGLSVQGSCPPA